jgi:hypothetical protein
MQIASDLPAGRDPATPYDDAKTESFMKTLKAEEVDAEDDEIAPKSPLLGRAMGVLPIARW